MAFFRVVFGGLLLASIVCFALSLITRDPKWRRRGKAILLGTLLTGAAFFAVLYFSHYFGPAAHPPR